MSDFTILKESLAACQETETLAALDRLLESGADAAEIVAACNEGMAALGQKFDDGDAFIPDLMFAGMIMKKAMQKLEPLLADADSRLARQKTFVIGTVQHDVHDIGKDITAMILRGNGVNVIDLGVDVPPERFVEAVREHKPDFLGMSILLTTCYKSVMQTMEAVQSAGLRDSLRICIGGAAASPLIAERCNIDFYGKTAVDTVNWVKQF